MLCNNMCDIVSIDGIYCDIVSIDGTYFDIVSIDGIYYDIVSFDGTYYDIVLSGVNIWHTKSTISDQLSSLLFLQSYGSLSHEK